ncbi:MAG: MFS transporter, partial [Rhodospirillaceae bacterium]|nr:MFS transporter [Rhodospirillaceae bacterium]
MSDILGAFREAHELRLADGIAFLRRLRLSRRSGRHKSDRGKAKSQLALHRIFPPEEKWWPTLAFRPRQNIAGVAFAHRPCENICQQRGDFVVIDAQGAGELAAALRKASIRLLPFLALLYFLAFLDRVNVSFAALAMNQDLGLSPFIYGLGAGIFFLSYVLFEVPSNLILHKVGARKWIARIMITWGLVSAGTAFITGPNSFIAARLLLGLAEAGFFPGIILYLTYWYPAEVRGKIIGAFMLAIPLSTVVGAPISTALLDLSVFGLKGWQTLFLLEGLPSVLMGVITFFYLPDRPANATWLTESERTAIASRLAAEERRTDREHSLKAVLATPRLWLLGFVYFCIVLALYGLNFWTPLMV